MQSKHKQRGFTIVELLIVMAVLAILARIVLVAYPGITGKAHDDAVRIDLTKVADGANAFYVANGHYPLTTGELNSINTKKMTRKSYDTTGNAVLYCVTPTTGASMAIIAKSKSGRSYSIKDEDYVQAYATTFPTTAATVCTNVGIASATAYWIHDTTSGWMTNF